MFTLGSLKIILLLIFILPSCLFITQASSQWSTPTDTPAVIVHASVLPTGKVLVWSYGSSSWLWTPPISTGPGSFELLPSGDRIFCSGHCQQPDGSILVVGASPPGPVSRDVNLFNPFTETWTKLVDITEARFYPSCILLANRDTLILSGQSSIPEILTVSGEV